MVVNPNPPSKASERAHGWKMRLPGALVPPGARVQSLCRSPDRFTFGRAVPTVRNALAVHESAHDPPQPRPPELSVVRSDNVPNQHAARVWKGRSIPDQQQRGVAAAWPREWREFQPLACIPIAAKRAAQFHASAQWPFPRAHLLA